MKRLPEGNFGKSLGPFGSPWAPQLGLDTPPPMLLTPAAPVLLVPDKSLPRPVSRDGKRNSSRPGSREAKVRSEKLLGGLEMFGTWILWLSHHIGNFIIPTDEVHHFSEGLVETTNQKKIGETTGQWTEKTLGKCAKSDVWGNKRWNKAELLGVESGWSGKD